MDNEWLKKVRRENPARYELLKKINNFKRKERLLRNNPQEYKRQRRYNRGPHIYRIARLYSLTWDEYQSLVADPVCPICGRERKLVLDHDHTTGRIRSGICSSCNLMIGYAHENIGTLQAAIQYLNGYKDPINNTKLSLHLEVHNG